AIREVLDAQVERQHEVASRAHRADFLDVLHDIAVTILDHALGAVFTGEPVVEGELETFLPLVVDTGESDDVTRDLASRVITAVLAHQIDAGNSERLDLLR